MRKNTQKFNKNIQHDQCDLFSNIEVGRVVRFKSHDSLPEIDRRVNIRMFCCQFPKSIENPSAKRTKQKTKKKKSKDASNSNQAIIDHWVANSGDEDDDEQQQQPRRRRRRVSVGDSSIFSRMVGTVVGHVASTIGVRVDNELFMSFGVRVDNVAVHTKRYRFVLLNCNRGAVRFPVTILNWQQKLILFSQTQFFCQFMIVTGNRTAPRNFRQLVDVT